MAASEFTFTVHLSECDRSDDMLSDLARTVLRHAGYSTDAIAAMAEELKRGIAGHGRTSNCDVAFRTLGGELEIVVSQGGRRLFRASRQLPE